MPETETEIGYLIFKRPIDLTGSQNEINLQLPAELKRAGWYFANSTKPRIYAADGYLHEEYLLHRTKGGGWGFFVERK